MVVEMDAAQVPATRPAGVGAGRLRTIVVLVVAAIVIGAVAFLVDQPAAGVTKVDLPAGSGSAPAVGQVPPDFSGTAVDGTKVSLSGLKGAPVWLTFGASWCPDCRAEAPDVQAAFAAHKADGLKVVGVFIDEDASAVTSYAGKVGLTFPIVADEQEVLAAQYRTVGIPTHFFIGRDGTVREIRIGRLPPDEMEKLVQELLGS